MLQICNTYSQCCLWFPFSAKIWLFISCCLRPTVACLTFSHKIVVFRLQNDLINILQCLQIIHCLYFELKNSIVRSLILSLTFAWHHVFIALQWLHLHVHTVHSMLVRNRNPKCLAVWIFTTIQPIRSEGNIGIAYNYKPKTDLSNPIFEIWWTTLDQTNTPKCLLVQVYI